ncbi:MAG: hypothetical protein K2J93_05065 [Anaeroplasmataceae bacterium]|nr:hypothetical protein [Anaeroplasmataceae bacterium]
MKDLIKAFDNLPFIVKLILCIPVLDIVWSIYKIAKSVNKGHGLGILLGILTIIPGAVFVWLIDILSVLFTGKVWWLD